MRTYDETVTGNGPYTDEGVTNPLNQFKQWQAGKIAETNAKLSGVNYGNEGRRGPLPSGSAAPDAKQVSDDISAKYFKPSTGNLPVAGLDLSGYRAPAAAPTTNSPATQNDPWKGLAAQLANYSAARFQPQEQAQGGYAVLGDVGGGKTQTDLDNEEKTRRWRMDELRAGLKHGTRTERAAIGQMLNTMLQGDNQMEVEGLRGRNAQMAEAGRNRLTARGQDLQAMTSQAGHGLQARGQDLSYASQMQGLDRADAREQRGYTHAEAMEGRRSKSAKELKEIDAQANRDDPYRSAMGRLANVRADDMEQEAAYGKTPAGIRDRGMKSIEKLMDSDPKKYNELAAQVHQQYVEQMYELQKNRKANGGVVGYAEGGQVETPEQLLARMQAKYGVSSQPQAPQPQVQAPAPQPVRPPAQPQPQQGGFMDRLRNVATGGLERRMQGYAQGGGVSVAGRQVLGAGNGKSDSLPAVIDGEQPAALSTGEFVMPVEAVQHFGLDRLNKMVAAARKGLDTQRDQA